ncbi:aspartate--tRNA ligase [Candidatus Woesearchaeota archaeon]|nr:aspartate--tRNA ligase [Candidatus Woesearchaeota archaeon]
MLKTSLRTHSNGELTEKDLKKKVELCGFCQSQRDHGGLIFIDLRDRYGITQIVFDPKKKDLFKQAGSLRREDVIRVKGTVTNRPKGMENKELKTGQIEVVIDSLEILSKSETPPIEIDDRIVASEELRLKYRFLDLRRPIMQRNLEFRQKVIIAARKFMEGNHFLEVQTPMLVRPTPEGARDYIVPSRVNPGQFYALPQSPQLYKQILMISGIDRYFQLPAICLRDEDLRSDRQPEHSQLDFEMGFVNEKDIMDLIEELYKTIIKEVLGKTIKEKFSRLSYEESMLKYGNDKPDLRYGLELQDVTNIVKDSEFKVFHSVIESNGIIKMLAVETEFTRKNIEELTELATSEGAKGLAYVKIVENKLDGNLAKFFPGKVHKSLIEASKIKKGYLLFIADSYKTTNLVLGKVRQDVARRLNLIKKDELKFAWITDFPLFEWNEDEQKWDAMHHIFSSPKPEYIKYLEKSPEKVLGNLFDLVLNGTELGSGSIRISNPELQERVMKVIGLKKEDAEKKFGFLLNAYKYGSNGPHGGMGLGFDRFVAMLLGTNDIREVIAFPKNKAAQNPMDSSPCEVEPNQLSELHIKLDTLKKK